MFEKVTLIIPTHFRHQYLTRLLEYYRDINFKILIADSSENLFPTRKSYNAEYYHYPNYSPLKKLANIIQKVKTPYVFMCADDDFIVPESIKECISFLENNPNYASVQGRYIKFFPVKNDVIFQPMYVHFTDYHIDADDPIQRINKCMSFYMQLIFAIHRTENLKQGFALLKEFSDDYSANLVEYAVALISVINGKHKMLPIFYCARESIPNSLGKTHERLETIKNNPKLTNQFNAFIDSISTHLSNVCGFKFADSKIFVLDAIDNYVNKYLPFMRNSRIVKKNKRKIIKSYIETLKIVIYKIIERISPKIFHIQINREFFQKYEYLFLKNYKELFKIKNIVLSFPIKNLRKFTVKRDILKK